MANTPYDTVKRLLTESDERNDAHSRGTRLLRLKELHEVLEEWMVQLKERGPGPTAKEVVVVLDHLEKVIKELRDHG